MKLKIKGDKDSYEIELDYCASCAGGDDEAEESATPVVTIFPVNQQEDLKKCKEYFEGPYANKTSGCRVCGYNLLLAKEDEEKILAIKNHFSVFKRTFNNEAFPSSWQLGYMDAINTIERLLMD